VLGASGVTGDNPIVEAVCEFRYVRDEGMWDGTYPGLLFEKIRDSYPLRKPQKVGTWEFRIPSQLEETAPSQVYKETVKSRFYSSNEKKVVSVGDQNLSISSLNPYQGWDESKAEILRIFFIYDDIATSQDICSRVGLRYINHLSVIDEEDPMLFSSRKFLFDLTTTRGVKETGFCDLGGDLH